MICRWNYNVSTAQNNDRFIPYILFLPRSGCWCQIQTGPPWTAVAGDTGIQPHVFRNLIWWPSLSITPKRGWSLFVGYIPMAQPIMTRCSQDHIYTFLECLVVGITWTTPSKPEKFPEIGLIAEAQTLRKARNRAVHGSCLSIIWRNDEAFSTAF